MARMFIDPLGKEWYVTEVGRGSVPIEPGDYIAFNEESGFRVILGHLFLEEFAELHKENNLIIPESVVLSDEKK